jgi:hypothetical protein
MNSAPHLPDEDRRDFERVLDEALRSAGETLRPGPYRDDPAGPDDNTGTTALTAEQMRRMVLGATSLIMSAAASEYHAYVKLRAEQRTPPSATPRRRGPARRGGRPGRRGLRALAPDGAEPGGAGVAAVVATLAPILSGAAAVIFLLVGYVMDLAGPSGTFASTLLTTGWVFGAITAAAILAAATGLLLTALRNTTTSLRADERDALDAEVARAHDAWRRALLERGILPFLRNALPAPDPGTARIGDSPAGAEARARGTAPLPRLGPARPDFTSPDHGGPQR